MGNLNTIKDKRVVKAVKELAPLLYPDRDVQFEALWDSLTFEQQFKVFFIARRQQNIWEGREPGDGPLQLLERN